jgi:hypothetical protein
MPYEPYDTGWIKSMYAVLCLTWYLMSSGTLFHITSATSYNNLFIPLVELFNRSCELIGNIIVWIGNGIIKCESFVFQHFNYINPIYNRLKFIETGFSNLNINTGNPSYQSNPYNSSNNKASTGKHLSSYCARKRRHRRRHVISLSGLNQSKNDRIPRKPTIKYLILTLRGPALIILMYFILWMIRHVKTSHGMIQFLHTGLAA